MIAYFPHHHQQITVVDVFDICQSIYVTIQIF
jgi:hypothetical protein